MNKSTKYMVVIGLFLIEVTSLFLTFKSYANKEVDEIENANIIDNQTFAMYIENDNGEYDELLDSTLFPTDTHELNYELTTCVDNKGNSVDSSILAYSNGKVTATSNKTVFCYLYFEYLPKAYAIYSETDNSLRFYNNQDSEGIGNTYNDKNVTAIYTGLGDETYTTETIPWKDYRNSILTVEVVEEIYPTNISYWFYNLVNTNTLDLTKMNTSYVTDMSYAFQNTGYNVSAFNLIGISDWNTVNVQNMRGMFYSTGYKATSWNIGDLSDWDTSNMINGRDLFNSAGYSATNWTIGNLSNWNISRAKRIDGMFSRAGYSTKNFDIGDLSTKMVTLKDGTTYTAWDTSNLLGIGGMFYYAGYNSEIFNIGNIGNWNTNNINSLYAVFQYSGYNATEWYIGDLSNWNTNKVTTMQATFSHAGYNSETFEIGNIGNWDTSKVTTMGWMFDSTGQESTSFAIGDLSNWNTSNVTIIRRMFASAGKDATWSLDCSKWNVSKVIYYIEFNQFNESKIIVPNWVNEDPGGPIPTT